MTLSLLILRKELIEKTIIFGEIGKKALKFKAKQLSLFAFILDLRYFILLLLLS